MCIGATLVDSTNECTYLRNVRVVVAVVPLLVQQGLLAAATELLKPTLFDSSLPGKLIKTDSQRVCMVVMPEMI